MIDKKSILKMSKHVFKRGEGYSDHRLMHPYREWAIGLLVFVGIIGLGGIMTSQLFVKYQEVDGIAGDSGQKIPLYNEKVVTSAVEEYRLRTETYSQLVGDVVPVSQEEDVVESPNVEDGESTEAEGLDETVGVEMVQ